MSAPETPGAEVADSSASGTQGSGQTVALIATFTARPGCLAQVEELLLGLTRHVRQEPGNLAFEPGRSIDRPERFRVYERYRDQAAFEAHIGADYGAEFNKALAGLIAEGASRLEFLTPLPETPAGAAHRRR